MSKPLFVCISDIHYNVKNLELADVALRAAANAALDLHSYLVIAGDLHDTKGLIHATCMNKMIETFNELFYPTDTILPSVLIGNHDLINEKGENHALNFLSNCCRITLTENIFKNVYAIPYQSSPGKFLVELNKVPKGSIVIMHQGVKGAEAGDYSHDPSAIDVSLLKDYRCFSGHYHKHQTIGTLTYCGSPYSQSFGEANDGPKGYLVVNEDGTFRHVPLHFRKHVIIEIPLGNLNWTIPTTYNRDDLIWVKVTGNRSQLAKVDKKYVAKLLGLDHENFKLDKIERDVVHSIEKVSNKRPEALLDEIIKGLDGTEQDKSELMLLWRDILCDYLEPKQ